VIQEKAMLNARWIDVIGCDVFGTVVKFDGVPRDEVKAYAAHIKKADWSPLQLPESWKTLVAFDDAAKGIRRLRKKFKVVPLTNGPVHLISALSEFNGIDWDAYFPLESHRVFKPAREAYRLFFSTFVFGGPQRCLIVTANKDFGDLEGAAAVGMQSILIRGDDGGPKDLLELATLLGC
jgi:2-haloalkanoic acid dehalogenase type II